MDSLNSNSFRHSVVIPLHGSDSHSAAVGQISRLGQCVGIIFVDNNSVPEPALQGLEKYSLVSVVWNGNKGGIAGGFNRGISVAMDHGASFITLLDQDSIICFSDIRELITPFSLLPDHQLLVGPRVWDVRRHSWHQKFQPSWHGFSPIRLLISSGTTFKASDFFVLGPLNEDLFIDFVDHAWCFRSQHQGFRCIQISTSILQQDFGTAHPNWLCHRLGMQLYSPDRHFWCIRNLRWLLIQGYVPLDLRLKELLKMLVKPFLWLLFEPNRYANIRAILSALRAPLPKA